MKPRAARLLLWLYLFLSLVPVYWLILMSLKTNDEILGAFTLVPRRPRSRTTRPSSPIRTGGTAT